MTRLFVFMFALFAGFAAHADDIICDAGSYFDGTECVSCPDNYPNSDAGATAATECYSDEKVRDCTGNCPVPPGCADAQCNSDTCTYVLYNKAGWKPVIKSGCASCDDFSRITRLSAKPGCSVYGTVCELCPAGTYSTGGDGASCVKCPDGATSTVGSDECRRILNYLRPGDTKPTKVYIGTRKKTSPALAVQIGDDIFYGNMIATQTRDVPGLYVAYDGNDYYIDSPVVTESAFYVMTTPDTTSFNFSMTAAGDFTVDWGDGVVEDIVRDNTTRATYSHTYDVAGEYRIGFAGQATGYSDKCSSAWLSQSAIGFYSNKSVAKIAGPLGNIFPTIDGNNPGFSQMFANCTNLTGEIPVGFFGNLSGAPHSCMFNKTFYGTKLTGFAARNPDGSYLYDTEYNGQKWIDAYPDAFTDMYSGSGINSDF